MANFLKNLFGTGDENEGFMDYGDEGYDTSSSAVTEEEADYSSSYSSSSSSFMNTGSAPRAINIHGGSSGQPKITIMKPTTYEEVMEDAIARLREGTIIFLNLTTIGPEVGARVVDFMTGAVAMCGGRIKKVEAYCYAVAPKNVDWVGIIED